MSTTGGIVCAMLFIVALSTDAASQDSSKKRSPTIGKAYLFSVGGMLLPGMIGSSMLSPDTGWHAGSIIGATLVVGGLTWGVSSGYYYAGLSKYATISSIGRVLLFAGGGILDYYMLKDMPPGQGHPWYSALASIAVFTWDGIDLIFLHKAVKK